MDILSGILILLLIAAFCAWQMPDVLLVIEAKLHARRDGLRVERLAFQWHQSKLKGEN